jgi:steroid 5-alpha reductase family enzyme
MSDLNIGIKILTVSTFGFAVLGYLLSRLLKRNDVADILWGLAFPLVCWVSIELSNITLGTHQWVVFSCVLLWGLRLATYLAKRNLGKPEDKRYQEWRSDWGKSEPWRAFVSVFVLQSVLMTIIAAPLIGFFSIQSQMINLEPVHFVGLIVFLFGFLIETAADWQLMSFKVRATPGQICDSGLWGLSRHPNYFGEILVWWGVFLMTLVGNFYLWTWISPVLITFLLLKVSGIGLTEKTMRKNRGEKYLKYVSNTHSLFPFGMHDVLRFLLFTITVLVIDVIFIGYVFGDFFAQQLLSLARLNTTGTGFDALIWSFGLVYFCLPFGVFFFAGKSGTYGDAFMRGGFFGLAAYGVYEFTNLSLIKDWPIEMAFVDVLWGTVLCAVSACVLKFFESWTISRRVGISQ